VYCPEAADATRILVLDKSQFVQAVNEGTVASECEGPDWADQENTTWSLAVTSSCALATANVHVLALGGVDPSAYFIAQGDMSVNIQRRREEKRKKKGEAKPAPISVPVTLWLSKPANDTINITASISCSFC